MATFKDIAEGTHARREINLTLAAGEGEEVIPLDVRTLTPSEEIEVLASAATFAKANGAAAGVEGDARYDFGRQLFTVLLGCVERGSPKDAPRPFFESPEQILASKRLTRDHVAYLHSHVEQWQEACSPRKMTLSPEEFAAAVTRTDAGDVDPFLCMRPGMQWSFARTLVRLHVSSRADRSSSGSASTDALGS